MGKPKPRLCEMVMGPIGVSNDETCSVRRSLRGKTRAVKGKSGGNFAGETAKGGEWGSVNV
jgi:hypothetical protein